MFVDERKNIKEIQDIIKYIYNELNKNNINTNNLNIVIHNSIFLGRNILDIEIQIVKEIIKNQFNLIYINNNEIVFKIKYELYYLANVKYSFNEYIKEINKYNHNNIMIEYIINQLYKEKDKIKKDYKNTELYKTLKQYILE